MFIKIRLELTWPELAQYGGWYDEIASGWALKNRK